MRHFPGLEAAEEGLEHSSISDLRRMVNGINPPQVV